jgi:hypothetical protein
MSKEDRDAIISIIMNIGVNGWMLLKLRTMARAGAFDGPDALQVWAMTVIWIVPVCIVAVIVLTTVWIVVGQIMNPGEPVSELVDERDRMFRIRGMAVTMVVASFGFVGAIAALAWGWSAVAGFTLIYIGYTIGDLAGNIVKFASYRIGG